MRILRANALYLMSSFLLDDVSVKSFMQIDALNALIMLTVAIPSLTYPEEDSTFAFGRDVR